MEMRGEGMEVQEEAALLSIECPCSTKFAGYMPQAHNYNFS